MFRRINQAIKQYPRRLQETARDANFRYRSYVTTSGRLCILMAIYCNDATHLMGLCDNATDVRRNGEKLAARISLCFRLYSLLHSENFRNVIKKKMTYCSILIIR
jgi:hypothetical protein